jgi:hypothetical protein
MTWLWFVGPVVTGLVYALTGRRDKRRDAEIDRWRQESRKPRVTREVKREEGAVYRAGKEVTTRARAG